MRELIPSVTVAQQERRGLEACLMRNKVHGREWANCDYRARNKWAGILLPPTTQQTRDEGVKSIWSPWVPVRREGTGRPESRGVEWKNQDRLWREEHGNMEVSTGASRA